MNEDKKLTIIHANDIHGQLAFKVGKDMRIRGGISLLYGYIKKIREDNESTFFGICGDVLQEDIYGSDYKGSNTVSLVNLLNPDAVSIGNHELDYGLAHLLIFNQCLNSHILCGNIIVTPLSANLFEPSKVFDCNGVKVLAIGVIPKSFLQRVMSDDFCRLMLGYKETYDVIRDELKRHEREKIDLVVLMSHYGLEGDEMLAKEMPEDLHVDIILGGHSHINMDKAEVVNNIVIAQSSYGSTHVGHFDITLGPNGGIKEWNWARVELDEDNSIFSTEVDELADTVVFAQKPKRKNDYLCTLPHELKNESRFFESEVGDLIADAFANKFGLDMMFLQSGSLRKKAIGPEVLEGDLKAMFPFDDRLYAVRLTGRELKEAFRFIFNPGNDGIYVRVCLQYSKNLMVHLDCDDYKNKGIKLLEVKYKGEDFEDEREYTVGMTGNCIENSMRYFGFVIPSEKTRLLSLSTFNTLAGCLLEKKEAVEVETGGRIVVDNCTE